MGVRVPDYRVTIDGEGFTPGDLTDALRPRLMTLSLAEERGETADQLDLTLDDADGRLELPRLGAVITLALGWRGEALTPKGTFTVDERAWEGSPDRITLRARSADFTQELKVRRDRSWRDATLGDVLGEIAGDHGLDTAVDADLATTPVPLLDQSGRSDADLLRRLGHDHDATATIKAGRLVFSPAGKGSSPSGQAFTPFTLVRRDGDNPHYREGARDGDYAGASAVWHDRATGERKEETAGDGSEGKPRRRLRRVHATQAQAARAAKAAAKKAERAKATFSYDLAEGRPDLGPERRGRVSGFKPPIDALEWLIKSARHELGDSGLKTSLDLEVAGEAEA